MVLRALVAAALATVLAAGPVDDAARYVESRQAPGGCFAEPGAGATPGLTAWAVLGLRAAGREARGLERARACLARSETELRTATDVELALLARAALGERPPALVGRVQALRRPSGAIGPTVNSTIFGVLALRSVDARVAPATTRYLERQQARSGGWSWSAGGAPDSNDTAAAVQALRAAGARGRVITRALTFVRRHQNADGGFELTLGRGSDAQSTAWAVQAFLSAGARPPRAAFRYLARLRRADGSYRYSARYVTTPVWVTSQVLAALAGKPLPLRS